MVVNTENCDTTEGQEQSPSAGPQRLTTATKSLASRKKKNKKRTTKTTRHATAGNNRSTLKASRVDAQGLSEATVRGCVPEAEGSVPLKDLSVRFVTKEGGATKISGTDETLLPIKPVSALADDGKCPGRKATTAITEKQEREKWEVDELMCERATEKETEAVSSPSTRRDQYVESDEEGAGEFLKAQRVEGSESLSIIHTITKYVRTCRSDACVTVSTIYHGLTTCIGSSTDSVTTALTAEEDYVENEHVST